MPQGIPGAGKSVIASSLIHRLQQEDVPVLYFFFRHTLDTNNSPEALLRDWLAQILKFSPPLQHDLSERDHRNTLAQSLPLDVLWRYIRRALMYLPNVYCVIDAMDEMDAERLEAFVRSLDALGRWRPAEIKLAVTSRPVAIVQKAFSRGVQTLDVRLDKKRVEGDVSHYIQHRLDVSSVSPERHAEVRHAVLNRADGLFLYAKLVLDVLLQPNTRIPLDLAELPANLTKMYADLLTEHFRKTAAAPEGSLEFVLQLVTHATRPLRLLEIVDIVRLVQGQGDFEVNKDLIRSLCGPLIEILPDETVRIVHHSLTEYLKDTSSTPEDTERIFPVFAFAATHHRVATACLWYLASGCLDHVGYKKRRQVSGDVNYIQHASLDTDKVLPPFTRYAGSNWAVHMRRAASAGYDQTGINDMLDDLLVGPNLDKVDVLINTQMGFQPTPLHFAIGLELKDYAIHLLSNKKAEYMQNGRLEDSLILYATSKGNEQIVKILLDHGADPGPRNRRGRTPLHLAVEGDHTKVAAILMDVGIDPDVERGPDNFFGMPGESEHQWTPLEHVFARGSLEMVTIFSERLQRTETVTKALYHAVTDRNTNAIKVLLRHPHLDIDSYYQDSPVLFAACTNRDVSTIELLLRSGATVKPSQRKLQTPEGSGMRIVPAFEDAELNDVYFETGICPANLDAMNRTQADTANSQPSSNVLHAWARGLGEHSRRRPSELSETEISRSVRLLLAHGANVHQVNEKGETPLHLAKDAATIKALLEGGADPNAVNAVGETVLHLTFAEEILDVLLPRADLNLQTHYTKRTPLLYALIEGYHPEEARIKKAIRLIESGASITAADKYGNSALHLALGVEKVGEIDIGISLIEKLCSFGANVNLKNYQGKSPLHMNAPGSGRVGITGWDIGRFDAKIMQILIAAGANVNAQDSNGQTALFQVVQKADFFPDDKKTPIFDTFLQAGAKIDTLDSRGRSLLHAQVFNSYSGTALLERMVHEGLNPTHIDHEGNTLLHEAAPQLAKIRTIIGAPSLIQKLVEMSVDPRQRNHLGRTPLHILASIHPGSFDPGTGGTPSKADHLSGFDFYLSRYPDLVDCADAQGVLPLHLASTFSEYMTRRLLEEGASPSKPTREGLTPLHLAARSRQANIIGILLDRLRLTFVPDELITVLNAKDTLNRTTLYYAVASGLVESCQLLLDAGVSLNHDSYNGSAWNGCVEFEEELKLWPIQTLSDDRVLKRKDFHSVKVDAGGIMISDQHRFRLSEDRQSKVAIFPTERLDEILELMASVTLEDQISFVDQAIASAAEKGHDYTVECLLRMHERLTGGAKQHLDEKVQPCLKRRQEMRSVLETGTSKDSLIKLMQSRHYGVVTDLLTPASCLEVTIWDVNSSLASQFASCGFATLLRKAASPEVISKTEWGKDLDRTTIKHGWLKQPLLISACTRETPNMAVVRVLVEDKEVDVNARMLGSTYPDAGKLANGPSALHYLAEGKHWWQVSQAIPYLVHHGADLEAVEWEHSLTPLGSALKNIHGPRFRKETVEMLLSMGANANGADGMGISYLSWTIDYPEIFQLLVRHGAVISRSVLAAAIEKQDIDLLKMLLSNGADPNQRKVGEERPREQLSETNFTMERNDPYLHDELYLIEWMTDSPSSLEKRNRDVDDTMLEMLLDHGADPFAPYVRTTVLHRVVENRKLNFFRSGHNDRLDFLLRRVGRNNIDTRDAEGMTLFLLAVKRDFGVSDESVIEIMEKLLALGADISTRDNSGRSVLHHGCNFKKRCDFILSKAADLLDSPDSEGKTSLHHALKVDPYRFTGHYRVASPTESACALMNAGANVTRADNEGTTPLHLALHRSTWTIDASDSIGGQGRDLFDLLVSKGAQVNARTHAGEPPIFGYVRSSDISAETDLSELGPAPENQQSRDWPQYDSKKRCLEQDEAVRKEGLLWEFFGQQGVDLHAVNTAGEGLLHLIAQDTNEQQRNQYPKRRVERFKYLMRKGLDPAMEDKEHRSPLDVAAALGGEDILELFNGEDGL